MLAIHYSPVKNTKQILRQGLTKSAKGTFCFLMTGNPRVDKWWAQAFRTWRPRTQYNGFVFRVEEQDMPAAFGHWLHGAEEKPLHSLAEIERQWRDSLTFRSGERFVAHDDFLATLGMSNDIIRGVGAELIAENPRLYTAVLEKEPDFLTYVFQITNWFCPILSPPNVSFALFLAAIAAGVRLRAARRKRFLEIK